MKRTVVPVYFTELDEQGAKMGKTKKQQTQNNTQLSSQSCFANLNYSNAQSSPHLQFYPGIYQPYMHMGSQFPFSLTQPSFGNVQPMISTIPSPILSEKSPQITSGSFEEEDYQVNQGNAGDFKDIKSLEKTVHDLVEGQKQLQNQLAGLLSYVSNISTKGKKNKKKTTKENEEEDEEETEEKKEGEKKDQKKTSKRGRKKN